ncbi:hypothetical protein LWI29_012047 [Acer saccharum]|uniref:Uncharacterized protein n=1 Tax=Acer saccharum TaxID=4024 RepID=A0AA39VMF1_ACESA|nr:hypothetical protein LWI29_012047 [Acer saccharum]
MTALHNKVGDKPVVVTTEQHIHPSSNIGSGEKSPYEGTGQSIHSEVAKSEMPDVLADTGVDAKLDESDLQSKIVDAKLDDTDVLAEGSGEASALDPDAGVAKTALNTEMDASDVSNAVTKVSAEYMLFNPSEMDEINNSVLLATQQHVPQSKVQVQGITFAFDFDLQSGNGEEFQSMIYEAWRTMKTSTKTYEACRSTKTHHHETRK